MLTTGSIVVLRTTTNNTFTGALEDAAPGTLALLVIDPNGKEQEYKEPPIVKESTGKYYCGVLGNVSGLWHFRWTVEGEAADEGTFEMESEFDPELAEPEQEPDLTDLKVLVPRARRKIEGPFGLPQNRAPLTDSVVYNMVGDAVGEVVMLSGSFFTHKLEVKERDPLGGFPTAWKTNTALEEYEAAIICAQVGLNFYQYLFRDMKVSESIQNEGTMWDWSLSANAIRTYYESLMKERDDAITGLRINKPVMDRYASNIRVRDVQTVAVLEWWAGQYDQLGGPGGIPGGQEAAVVPIFYPPGVPI